MLVYQIADHVLVASHRHVLGQLRLCSVQPVIQGLEGVCEPA